MSPDIVIGPLHADDWGWVIQAMLTLPGGERLTDDQCREAIRRSVCLAAYHGKKIVGVVRCVTDGSTFASITELYVSQGWRKAGIGTALMEEVMGAYRGVVFVLQARGGVEEFYRGLGFAECKGVMMRGAG